MRQALNTTTLPAPAKPHALPEARRCSKQRIALWWGQPRSLPLSGPALGFKASVPAELGVRIVTFVCLGSTYVVALYLAQRSAFPFAVLDRSSVVVLRAHSRFHYWNTLLADGLGLIAMFLGACSRP